MLMQITNGLTDDAVLEELGSRLARARLERDLTQQQLAQEAGISVDTVRRLERKQSITLTALLRILRALGQLDVLDLVLQAELPSPIEQLERERRRRQRASGAHSRARKSPPHAEPGAWDWGGEP
jgi:transcriptional regulator with XRE-family HTH domain